MQIDDMLCQKGQLKPSQCAHKAAAETSPHTSCTPQMEHIKSSEMCLVKRSQNELSTSSYQHHHHRLHCHQHQHEHGAENRENATVRCQWPYKRGKKVLLLQ